MSKVSDHQLALAVLQREGLSRDEAALAVVNDPGVVERLGDEIGRMRSDLEAQAEQAKADAFAATPDGRAKAAHDALVAKAEREKLVEGAKVLLEQGGTPTDGLVDEQILHYAGIERIPELMSMQEKDAAIEEFALSAEYGNMSPTERAIRAGELGVKTTTIDSYREMHGIATPGAEGAEGGEAA